MKRYTLLLALLLAPALYAQEAQSFKQHDMKRWGIPAGNYSGITPIGGDRYALIADSQNRAGNALYHLKDYIRVILIH